MTGERALVDTGATESCIDSMLATQLGLPVADKRMVAGIHGSQEVSFHLAQIHIPYWRPRSIHIAQLRHLLKERFGSHVIDKRHLGNGLYEYRLVQ
jgi:hypothetical protein